MLNSFTPDRAQPEPPHGYYGNPAPFHWLPDALAFISRRQRLIAGGGLAGIAVAAGYLLFATSQYTAVATLNIDSGRANPIGGAPLVTDWQSESAYIDSQVALIESPATLRGVVTQMNLAANPLFAGHSATTATAPALAELSLSHMLDVSRVGATSVVELRVHTPDPVLSAAIANAVGQAYMAQQLLAISDTTAQAGSWLQSRIGELRGQAVAADQAVQEYKAQHNIADVTTGAGTGLMDEQQLGELNVELAAARARTAAAEAQYDQAEADSTNGVATDTQANPVMAGLQQQYLDAIRQLDALISRLGPEHGAVALQRRAVASLQQSIRSEMALELAGDRANFAAATADQAQIQARLKEEIAAEAQTNIQLSELTSLQSSADAYREIYQNFLQRYTQAIQDQSYPIANARVAAAALPPPARSSPHRGMTLAIGLLLGLALGLMIAVIRETLDMTVRSAAQLRQATGLNVLGSVAESPALVWSAGQPADRRFGTDRLRVPAPFRDAASNPASGLADAVQNVRVAAARQSARGRDVRIIGCVSAAPREGCSTFAANLACVLAADGQRTALVDWNAQSPTLTGMFCATPQAGLAELLTGQDSLAAVAKSDSKTQLSFIGQSLGAPAAALPGPAKIQALLAELRSAYDIVILDLPPLQASSAALQLSDWVDGFVLVTEYGATSQAALAEALSLSATVDAVFLGAILNRCPPAAGTFEFVQPLVSRVLRPAQAV